MRKTLSALLMLVIAATMGVSAQIVTTTPSPLQESSQGVVLTFHADSPLGNNGLKDLGSNFDVYAHIGVITNKSTSSGDWKYVVAPWPESGNAQAANTAKNKLTRVAGTTNDYTLTIGDIRTYFGITNTAEYVKQIALVFRNVDGSKTGKTKSNGDIFVDVLFDGYAIELTSDHPDRVIGSPTTVKFTLEGTASAQLSLSVNGTQFASQTGTSLTASYTFKETGYYTVEGKAVYNGTEYKTTQQIDYIPSSGAQNYPGGTPKQGAVKNADGSVTFCLAAPGKFSVQLVPSWDDYQILDKNLMKYQDYNGNRYFWTTVSGLADDVWYSYYYIVDDTYKVADPYAHLVLDCYSDNSLRKSAWTDAPRHPGGKLANIMLAVYRGDIDDYTFTPFTIPAHDNLLVYEMLFRDFTGPDGENMGWGTVKKAIDKIPYIKEMGFNCVELMPIMEFNGNNSWGYNTNFYMAPDKAYGSPTDYKDFIEACHKQGIAVVLDIVFNQSDGLHPWYQMYPIKSNPFYNEKAPHGYSVLNDWNQDNALVQQQWTDALKYWMEKYNVDGYRFDLVKGLGDNNSYGSGTEAYNSSRVARMKRLHSVIKSVKANGIHINENLAGAKEETEMGEDGQLQWANINDASCQYTMGWDNGDNNLLRFLSSKDSRPWGSTVSYAESHDEQRMGYKNLAWGQTVVQEDKDVEYNRLAALAVQMLLTPGPKMVWMFGELGDDQNTKDDSGNNNTSPKIVNWKWLDDPHKAFLKDTYKAINNARINNPELFAQSATFTSKSLSSKFTNARSMRLTAGAKEIVAFINPSVTDAMDVEVESVNLTGANAKLICASHGFNPTLAGTTTKLNLNVPANGFAVFATNNISGVESVAATPESNVQVRGDYGSIVVEGIYNNAVAYNLSGRAMPCLTGLAAGIYIVNVDGTAHKVLVK